LGHDLIQVGSSEIVIAGGMENMSLAPYLLPGARKGIKYGAITLLDHLAHDGLEDAYRPQTSMGLLAEELALERGYSREQQDAFAKESLERAQKATRLGYFLEEIHPLHGITTDEIPSKVDVSKISQLSPV